MNLSGQSLLNPSSSSSLFSDVDVPFHWLNFYSQFEVPRQENDDTESCDAKSCVTDGKSDREFVPNSYFTIDPKSGLLPACGIMKFDIIFSPEKVIHVTIFYSNLNVRMI